LAFLVAFPWGRDFTKEWLMNRIVYIVGAVVIILFILGFLGLR
jgi:small-conductance mechanosensitive channel